MKKIINLILISIVAFSSFKIVDKQIKYSKDIKVYSEINEIASDNSHMLDKSMLEVNNEYRFWIKVENTNIDYPVAQGKDNDYYINHDFNKNENISGAIFLDYRNNFINDLNTIVYGHHMRNETMFNNLVKFKDSNFFNENNKIKIIYDGKELEYKVFSVYVIDDKNNYLITNFNNNNEYNNYIKEIRDRSLYKNDVEVTDKDKIITLSTCSFEFEGARTVVHGKLINN
ncbi:class B sortase [Clostridium septicum]|uniref:Class B sortase n=1 Tax=Clostridium septicum TaxID=1504 RepID=A0A9N7PK78_CLOSE|nr:class B sortase [Clostridium septicum]AYE33762.1 SrtB family sortase [Clostridium septicum]MDU1313717.1 class B sortase [Clostridium septicum]QAS61919.1 class B sortase [Clostridium septicum]UEC21627.1 class B sortase [Clostridium septicum]USS00323.1 class B sortase [Clostridium septicum]